MLKLDAYRRVLSVPGFAAFLLLGLLLNVPVTAAPVVLVLHTATGVHGAGFGAAGLVVALWTTGMAVGSPLQGWLMDRRGLRGLFIVAALVHAAFWACASVMPVPVLAVAAFASGLFVVSGGTTTRLAITAIVPEDRSHTAFALNSMLTSLSLLVVPAVAVVVATRVGDTVAVLGVGAAFVLACALSATRELPAVPRPSGGSSGAVRSALSRNLVITFGCVAAVGVMTSGSDFALLATLSEVGQATWAGAVMAVCAAGALFGGLVYGSRERGWPPAPVVAAIGVCMLPIGLWADWRWMIVAFVPGALLVPAAFSALAQVAGKLAPPGARATVMSIFGTAVMVGNALGPTVAGVVHDLGPHQVGFVVVGGVGVLAGLLAWHPLRGLVPAGPHTPPPRVAPPTSVQSKR